MYVYEGLNGGKEVFNDILKILKGGDEQLVISASFKSKQLHDFLKRWNKKREKNGVRKKIILLEDDNEFINEFKKQKLTQTRIMSKELKSPMAIDIYGNKIAVMLLGNYPITILIENKLITESFKRYFQFLWKKSKKPIS